MKTALLLAALLLAAIACYAGMARAQSGAYGDGHAEMHNQYMGWHENGVSCCNGQDCRPGRAKQDGDGNWSIYIPEYGRYVPVPPGKVGEPDRFRDGRNHFCTADPDNWIKAGNPWVTLPVYCLSPAEQRS